MQTWNARIGLVLFSVYLILFGGFVWLNAFSAETMQTRPLAGLNLAILYGFGLILAAIVLSLIYGLVAREETDPSADSTRATPAKGEEEQR